VGKLNQNGRARGAVSLQRICGAGRAAGYGAVLQETAARIETAPRICVYAPRTAGNGTACLVCVLQETVPRRVMDEEVKRLEQALVSEAGSWW
jgi:hypothetical protein